jgi:hypothetical protein
MSVTTTTPRTAGLAGSGHEAFSTLVANLATLAKGETRIAGLHARTLRVTNKGSEWVVAGLDDDMRVERVVYVTNELGVEGWQVQAVRFGSLVPMGAFVQQGGDDGFTAALARALVVLG